MNGYSKIKLMNSNSKSRSMDFSSDQTIPTPRLIQNLISINKSIIPHNPDPNHDPNHDDDDYKQYSGNQQEDAPNFPMKMLSRNKSVAAGGTTINAHGTSTPSSRFKIEKQNSTGRALQTAVVRAFSIRSSSVSERYSRIHDQYANPLDDVDHLEAQEQEEDLHMGISKKKKSKGSILKACKRIFGL